MSDQEELAQIVSAHTCCTGYCATETARKTTDALIAAGYRKPRTITTEAELDALDLGAVLLAQGERTGEGDGDQVFILTSNPKGGHAVWRNHWITYGHGNALLDDYETLTVLHEGADE